MSSRKFKFVSPGIFLNEIDNSQLPKISDAIGPVIIGNTQMGPALKPVRVESFSEFVNIFGTPQPGGEGDDVFRDRSKIAPTYAAYAAQAYLKNSSPVNIVRLLGVEDPNAADSNAAAKAGWKASQSDTNESPAYGLFVGSTGSAHGTNVADNMDMTLAAVFYAAPGTNHDTVFRLDGKLSSVKTQTTASMGVPIRSDFAGGLYPLWKMRVVHKSGSTETEQVVTFNFDRSSSQYIRKVFNTNPTLTNDRITRSEALERYWLGESFENYVNNEVLTNNSNVPLAMMVPLKSSPLDHGVHQEEMKTSESGWVISQDLLDAASFDARVETRARKLFKIVSIGEGTFNQNNFKVSISNITAPQKDGIDPYGTFDVVLRKVTDVDGAEQNVEKFSSCTLNPNSPNYIARKIGDVYLTWDAKDKRYRHYGNYANRSKYIRVEMDPDVDAGALEPALLPFGAYMPPVLKDVALHRTTTTAVAASVVLIADSAPVAAQTIIIKKADGADYTMTVKAEARSTTVISNDSNLVPGNASEFAAALKKTLDLAAADGESLAHITVSAVTNNSGGDPRVITLTQESTGAAGNTVIAGTLVTANKVIVKASGNNPAGGHMSAPIGFSGGIGPLAKAIDGTFKALDSSGASKFWLGQEVQETGKANGGDTHIISGSYNDCVTLKWPKLRMRLSSSHGNLNSPYDAFFGLQTSRTALTSRFDSSYVDFVRRFPSGLSGGNHQTGEAVGDLTKYSEVFTLDDIVVHGNNNDIGVYISGSRQRADATGLGKSHTAKEGWRGLLGLGFNKFSMPLWAGSDGVDITEQDPFNNEEAMISPADSRTSYAYASVARALDSVADPEVVECNMMSMPGITIPSLTTQMVRTCEARADALAIIDLPKVYLPPHETTAATFALRLENKVTATVDALNERGINSSYGCTYYPWVKIYDEINEAQVWAPPSIIAMGVFANTEKRAAVWFAPAGFNRGGLTEGSAGLKVLGVTERVSSKDRDKLYAANINPIATFPAEGIVVFGQKTLQITASALDRINVRRLLIFVKKRVSRIASNLLFDQNVQSTWDRFVGQVDPFLNSVKMGFGLTDFKVVLDQSTTTPDLIDRNIMYAKIFLKPARSIEYIAVDFVITNTGAAFED